MKAFPVATATFRHQEKPALISSNDAHTDGFSVKQPRTSRPPCNGASLIFSPRALFLSLDDLLQDFKHILDSVTTFFLGSRGALLVCRAEGAGGFTLDFEPKEEALRRPFSTSFIFSGRAPNALRIHSREHCNNMCFFLGENEPREWVVWDMPTRPDGTWEVVALEWLDGDEGHFKINGGGQYVKWVVCGFASTRDPNEASVFTMLEA